MNSTILKGLLFRKTHTHNKGGKRQVTFCEKIFATCVTVKRLKSRVYKKLLQNNKKKTIFYKNGQSTSTDISQKRKYKWPLQDIQTQY